MTKNPVKIMETAFRDAHQSLLATRMRVADMLPIAAKMNEVGKKSFEEFKDTRLLSDELCKPL